MSICMKEKNKINGVELEKLLQDRRKKKTHFILVDVREQEEYDQKHIIGVDYLIPTSVFLHKLEQLEKHKKEYIVLQCRSGVRSHQVQQQLKAMNFKKVINLEGGILSYSGKTS